MERAKLLFGCYRRGDANDPDTYVAAVTMVLSRYSADIVQAVTDPYSGLPARKSQNGWTGMPDVADVKEACEAEAARLHRLATYAAMPGPDVRRLAAPAAGPGSRANVLVKPDAPHSQHQRMTERAKRQDADTREWRMDDEGRGIWVALSWLDGVKADLRTFRTYTDDELRAMYPAPPAPAQPDEEIAA